IEEASVHAKLAHTYDPTQQAKPSNNLGYFFTSGHEEVTEIVGWLRSLRRIIRMSKFCMHGCLFDFAVNPSPCECARMLSSEFFSPWFVFALEYLGRKPIN